MTAGRIEVRTGDEPELANLLGRALYEFNVSATGISDGELFHAAVAEDGEVVAAVHGHTWGGTCEVSRLWVHESRRHAGLGSRLMAAVEDHAVARSCTQIYLSTHSFQAPAFYERLGFDRLATIPDYPRGHDQAIYLKRL